MTLRISQRASAVLLCSDNIVRISLAEPLDADASRSSCSIGEQGEFFLTHVKVEIDLQ